MRKEPAIPTWLVVCCFAMLALALFVGPLAATLAQSPTPEPSYEELLAQQFAQPDGYAVDRVDVPGYLGDVIVVRDRKAHVTCYIWDGELVCLNTYEVSR